MGFELVIIENTRRQKKTGETIIKTSRIQNTSTKTKTTKYIHWCPTA